VPGRRYVIQVQAADINGLDEFENNGLSEVSTFSFGNPSEAPAMKLCKKPSNFLAEKLDEQSVQLTWQETNSETPIDYLVNYKTENEGIWNERIVADPSLILVQLAPAQYKFKVYARCTYENKSAFTNEMSMILESPKPEETPEVEPQDTYVNTDPEPITPSEYEPEQTKEPAINIFNTPIKIILDSEDLKNLPDSLQLPKGYEKLGSLPVLSDKPSIEDLKAALQTQKIDCASYLAGYSCGQHDAPAVPSGDIIQVKTGDEIAINSVGFEVVDLDASGNGKGIVKVSMFNNAKFGVEFKGIKVAKGGCVVAGEAILSNVDVALLSEEQRKKLAETYAAFNKVLDVADKYAEQIAETYNSLADFTRKVKTDVTNYVGSVKEAKKMKSHFKAAEKYAELILKNPNLSDSTKKKLQEAYDNALGTKEFFCNGKPCVEARQNEKKGGGPSVISEVVLSICEENKQKLASMTDIMDKAGLEIEKAETNVTLLLPPIGEVSGNTENDLPENITKTLLFNIESRCSKEKDANFRKDIPYDNKTENKYVYCKYDNIEYFLYKGGSYWKINNRWITQNSLNPSDFVIWNSKAKMYQNIDIPDTESAGLLKKFLSKITIESAKSYYHGDVPLENLTKSEKMEIFKNDSESTIGILLYEFATGTGEQKWNFNADMPYSKSFLESVAIDEALYDFYVKYDDLKKKCAPCQSLDTDYYFAFSPDKTIKKKGVSEGIREFINKQVAQFSKDNKVLITRGGMKFKVKYVSGENLNVTILDGFSYSSLAAHLGDSFPRKSNIVTPFGNTEIEVNLKIKKFDTTKEGLLYYKNRVDDVLNK
jgi:tetratricopeptide (TPR) repeat protein